MFIGIRPARDEDEVSIRSLFKVCFDKELTHEEWLWKYKASYLGSSAFVAEYDGKIVAHYGGFKMYFYSHDSVFHAYQGCDVMTHPQYRARLFAKKGIIVKTAEAFYEANPMEFIFGFPSERHARLMELQLKWEKHRFINVMKKGREDFKAYRNLFLRVETKWDSISPKEMDDLWIKTRHSFILSIEKDSRYILWRYRGNPQRRYETIVLRGLLKRDLKAYMVIKMDNNEMCVLDFFVSNEMDFGKVLAVLEYIAVKRKAMSISLWVNPAEKIYQELKNAGYREEKGIPYTLRVFENTRLDSDFFLDNYCYSMGDYDAA